MPTHLEVEKSLPFTLNLDGADAKPVPCSNLIPPRAAVRLNVAQVLPTFSSLHNVLLTFANICGDFRDGLVRHCIINQSKMGRPVGAAHHLVVGRALATSDQTQGRLEAAADS